MLNTTMYNFLDARYQVIKLHAGREKPSFQSLFFDELLGFTDTQAEAENRCYQHRLLFYKELEEGFKS